MELSDVLNEKATPAPAAAAPASPEPVVAPTPEPAAPAPAAAPERGADGKFVAKGETPPTSVTTPQPVAPKQELTPQERAFLARAQEETRKRQALEQELAQLRQKPAEPPKQFWDDPDGALKQQTQFIEAQKQEFQQMLLTERMQNSEATAREKYSDFDVKIEEFAKAVQEIPGLAQQFMASRNPADFAYKTAKSRIELREAGSVEQIIAKREIELRAKWEAELAEKQKAEELKRNSLPSSLSEVPGTTGAQGRPVWGGPTPLGSIVAR